MNQDSTEGAQKFMHASWIGVSEMCDFVFECASFKHNCHSTVDYNDRS